MNGRLCECVDEDCSPEGCTNPPYSWSIEHDNSVLCRKCYQNWLKKRNYNKAADILTALSPQEKQKLLGAMKSAS